MTYQNHTLADTFLSFGGDVSISWVDDVQASSTEPAPQFSPNQLCYFKAQGTRK